jgi:hypothetical protein
MRRFHFMTVLALASCLCACDYGPAVDGNQPTIAHEVTGGGGGRMGSALASKHYFEVSLRNLAHPRELKAFFRWRCQKTYLPGTCTIDAWLTGAAPHHDLLLDEDKNAMVAVYYRNRATNEETFMFRTPDEWGWNT